MFGELCLHGGGGGGGSRISISIFDLILIFEFFSSHPGPGLTKDNTQHRSDLRFFCNAGK